MTKQSPAWRRSTRWQHLRQRILDRDGWACTNCGVTKQEGATLHADHIVAVNNGGDKWDPDNLRTLCWTCHKRKTTLERGTKPKQSRPMPAAARREGGVPLSATPTPAPLSRENAGPGPTTPDGHGMPRFLSDPHPDAVGSRYEEVERWGDSFLGVQMRPWQRIVLERALEVDENGNWCWGLVLLLVPRQQGKSVLVRTLGSWAASQGQTALHIANRATTAKEIWLPAAQKADEVGWNVTYSVHAPTINHPTGGRYMCQPSNDRAGVGFTLDLVMIDEAWDVRRSVYDQALSPAMSAVDNPLAMMVSTAGDSESDLLHHYREVALGGSTNVMLAEWSAPPGADWLDPAVWQAATPHWTRRREQFLTEQKDAISEPVFRSQYLCQWQSAVDGWIAPSQWEACIGTAPASSSKSEGVSSDTQNLSSEVSSQVVALEVSLEGDKHYLATSGRDADGRVHVTLEVMATLPEVNERLRVLRPATLLASPFYRDRLEHTFTMVGSKEIDPAMRTTADLIARQRLVHRDDERLTQQMLAARRHVTKTGQQTLVSGNGQSLGAVRALLWSVAGATSVQGGRPRLRVAR